MPKRFPIESREELIYLLSEAAELEHTLLCSYLFAAYSLKTGEDEGLAPEELITVRRWKATVTDVAIQEMLHLSLANNLLTAIGGAPHFERPNFPIMSRYYPAHMQIQLAPFTEETINHFVYLERPEDHAMHDAPRYEEQAEQAASIRVDAVQPEPAEHGMVAEPRDFTTVGALYRAVEAGFRELESKIGASRLFVEPARAQATTRHLRFQGLRAVTDLDSALASMDLILKQGEGLREHHENTHYQRYLEIQREYATLKARRPGFAPARPVLENPAGRMPEDTNGPNLIGDPHTVATSDLFNAAYEIMLQLLMRFFAHVEETGAELQILIDSAIGMMAGVLRPVGELLTTLPAGPSYPGMNAGPGFQMNRTTHLLPHKRAAWIILQERLLQIADFAQELQGLGPQWQTLNAVTRVLRQTAGRLELARD